MEMDVRDTKEVLMPPVREASILESEGGNATGSSTCACLRHKLEVGKELKEITLLATLAIGLNFLRWGIQGKK